LCPGKIGKSPQIDSYLFIYLFIFEEERLPGVKKKRLLEHTALAVTLKARSIVRANVGSYWQVCVYGSNL
jgi:hypothetical protein